MRYFNGMAAALVVMPFCLFSAYYEPDVVDMGLASEVEEGIPCEMDAYPEECCTEERWCRYICYEPRYYTVQKCIEKQVPTKRKAARLVPKQYTVQRIRYIPEQYEETITKNEIEYYYVDDWKTCTEMVVEQKCEWVPKYYWKKAMECESIDDDACEEEEEQQDDD